MCEQRRFETDLPVDELVRRGLDVMRSGPVYRVITGQSDDREPIRLLEQCNWWRQNGVLVNDGASGAHSWMPIAN